MPEKTAANLNRGLQDDCEAIPEGNHTTDAAKSADIYSLDFMLRHNANFCPVIA